MSLRLIPTYANRRIVITGGSSGLGLELANQLAELGARLVLVARDKEKLQATVSDLNNRYKQDISGFTADVVKPKSIQLAMNKAAKQLGGIDILFNNAGILREGYFENLNADDFSAVMDINFHGAVNATRAALPFLKASKGRLVNVSSMAGLAGTFGYTAYAASKHALKGFSEALATEMEPQDVRVQLVCPGEFDSPMVDTLDETRTPENKALTLTIPKATVEKVAADTLIGVAANRFITVPTKAAQAAAAGLRMSPAASRKLVRRTVAKAYVGPDKT